jgi:hypothetical protein
MTRQPAGPWRRALAPLLAALALTGTVAATALGAVPGNTAPPTITGGSTAREGQTLTATNGTWSNAPTSFRYQWQRCSAGGADCSAIASATNQTYTPGNADVDRRLRVVVTGVNADGQSSATSATTDVVSGGNAPTSTARPTITGTAVVGDELTATNGTWTGGATSFAYQWQRCDSAGGPCADVSGATGRVYGVRTADVGKRLRVEVTARNASSSSSATSDTTALVRSSAAAAPAPKFNRAPTIRFLSLREAAGQRVTARFRVCDDGFGRVNVIQRDVRRGVLSYTRRFASFDRACDTLIRTWKPAPRFRTGNYIVTLRAVDKSGRSSSTVRRSLAL